MNRSEMFKEINRIKTILNEKKSKKDSEIFASLKKFVALAGKLKEVMVDYEHLHFQEVFSKRLKLTESEILEKFGNLEIQLNALDNNISHYNERYPESEKLYSLEEALSFSEKLSAKRSERMNNFLKSKKNEQR